MTTAVQTAVGAALAEAPVLAILRYPQDHGLGVALAALSAGGIRVAEITATTPGWLEAIAEASSTGLVIGGGTVTSTAMVRDVAAAGGTFVVSPGFDPDVVRESLRIGLEPLPGVLTGSEIMAARALGVELFKLFPAGAMGTDYLRQLRGPFPDLAFLPTGGITATAAPDWMAAGAYALALGSELAGRDCPRSPAEADVLADNARVALAAAGRM